MTRPYRIPHLIAGPRTVAAQATRRARQRAVGDLVACTTCARPTPRGPGRVLGHAHCAGIFSTTCTNAARASTPTTTTKATP